MALDSLNSIDLPKFGSTLKCAPTTPMSNIISYFSEKLKVEKYVINMEKEIDYTKYVELVIDSGIKGEDGNPQYI